MNIVIAMNMFIEATSIAVAFIPKRGISKKPAAKGPTNEPNELKE